MAEILDLSTKRERPQLRIDDVLYDLMLPTDLELKDVLWLQKAAKRIDQLQKRLEADVVSDAVGNEFEGLMNRFSNLILGEVPEEVRNLLTDVQRMAVVDTYAELVKKQQASFFENGVASVEEENKNGSTSSLSSKDSTEEASKVG